MEKLNRRRFIAATTVGTAGSLIAGNAAAQGTTPQSSRGSSAPGERACIHRYDYRLDRTSYREETDTVGGFRRYVCVTCNARYEYAVAPRVYSTNPRTGKPVDHAGSTNPYLPLWEHVPDGEPHVFWSRADNEWRVYIYGSHDISGGKGYCGPDYVTWSAPAYDLSAWRYEGIIYDARGSDVDTLFAGDAAYDVTTDTFYLMTFEIPKRCALRRSDKPNGPFHEEGKGPEGAVYIFKISEAVDPAIYIEDGTIYVAGSAVNGAMVMMADSVPPEISAAKKADNYDPGGMAQVAVLHQMKPNPADGIARTSYLPVPGTAYFPIYEGASLRRDPVSKAYLFVYVSTEYDRAGKSPTAFSSTLAYAYSYDLMGGWTQGSNGQKGVDRFATKQVTGGNKGNVFSDTSGRYRRDTPNGPVLFKGDPTFPYDNNHGGIERINGQWYVFGHRHTGQGKGGRQGTIERLDVTMDGKRPVIRPAEMTSAGPGRTLDAFKPWLAGIACYLTPGVNVPAPISGSDPNTAYVAYDMTYNKLHGAPITNLRDGHVVGYKYIDFGAAPATALKLLFARDAGNSDATVEVWLDQPDERQGGTLAGRVIVSAAAYADAPKESTAGRLPFPPPDGRWRWLTGKLDRPVSGIHAVYLRVRSSGSAAIGVFDQFQFERA